MFGQCHAAAREKRPRGVDERVRAPPARVAWYRAQTGISWSTSRPIVTTIKEQARREYSPLGSIWAPLFYATVNLLLAGISAIVTTAPMTSSDSLLLIM